MRTKIFIVSWNRSETTHDVRVILSEKLRDILRKHAGKAGDLFNENFREIVVDSSEPITVSIPFAETLTIEDAIELTNECFDYMADEVAQRPVLQARLDGLEELLASGDAS